MKGVRYNLPYLIRLHFLMSSTIYFAQDDLISWLMDSAPSALERETSSIALRVLIANFMAHHSAFTTFTHAVYHLAAEPFYADDLREELLMHLSHPEHIENWTEKNLDQCWKLDSFLKETLRMHGIGACR